MYRLTFFLLLGLAIPASAQEKLTLATPKKSPASRVAISPGGDWIATAHSDRTIRVWDAKSGMPQAVLEGLPMPASDVVRRRFASSPYFVGAHRGLFLRRSGLHLHGDAFYSEGNQNGVFNTYSETGFRDKAVGHAH